MDYRKMKGWELTHEYEMAGLLDDGGNIAGKADREEITKEHDRRDAMLAAGADAIAALIEHEWFPAGENGGACLYCGHRKKEGHAKTCRIGNALAAYRAAEVGV